jgi:hypothetical protein
VKRPSVLLLSHIPFWRLGDGQRMRLLALVWLLGQATDLHILHLEGVGPADVQRLKELRIVAAFEAMPEEATPQMQMNAVRRAFAARRHDCCIVERLPLHFLRGAIPAGVPTVLDTHDLLSGHQASRRDAGLPFSDISFEQELAMLAAYDAVMMIQPDEHARVLPHLGDRALLVPHPVSFPRRPARPGGRSLGLVASDYAANLDGLDWFADAVWPSLAEAKVAVDVFGTACGVWRPGWTRFVRHGFVADFNRVWGAIDVALNPVRWGSGLKIKSVEALGNGLPLVSTSVGASGMLDAVGQGLTIADTPESFAIACLDLLSDAARREAAGAAAYAYAQRRFSAQACFAPLLGWLQGL